MDNGASSYRRFLDGDEDAFNEIVDDLFYGLVLFINRYVHDIHTAEDIAIDTLADLGIHRHRYNFKVKLKTYLFMVGRSRALNHIKWRKTVEFTELSEAEGSADSKAMLEDAVLANEKKRAVNLAVSKLPQEMQVAIYLIYFEDMTYNEVARIMKKSPKQVDNLLYRAKGRLRTILKEDGELLL